MANTILVVSLAAFLIFACFAGLSTAVHFNDCGSETGQLTNITVTGCSAADARCMFRSGTNVTLDAYFLSKTNSATATVKVWGIIAGMPLPFNINPSNACSAWKVNCPLHDAGAYQLQIQMPILSYYPKIQVQVKLSLLDDQSKNLICQLFPAQIV